MAFKPTNRLGWSRQGFDKFFELAKPGDSAWSRIKKNASQRAPMSWSAGDVKLLQNLFETEAKYAPLEKMFGRMMTLTYKKGTAESEEFRQLVGKIQLRINRLWNFARQESLVSNDFNVANKHAIQLIAKMRQMLYNKYRNTQMVDNMMKIFANEIRQDLREGNESHGDYNEIDVTFDAWEARYVDGTPDAKELRAIRDGKRF